MSAQERDGAFQRIAKMAANVFEAPIASVSLVGDDRVWFPAALGLAGMTDAPIGPGLIEGLQQQSAPFMVEDPRNDPRTDDHPVVRGEFGVKFYAAAPIAADGEVFGALEVMDSKRRRKVEDGRLELLGDLADTVAHLLQIRVSALDALRAERADRAAETARRDLADRVSAQKSQAETAERDRERPQWCQLGGSLGCEAAAELKVADSWGDSAWACWAHAEDALVQVPSVFLASESTLGLMQYRNRIAHH